MSSPKLLYIPSYEDAAGTDPVTPAGSFAGGVVSKNYIPVTIDWDTFPSQLWIRDGNIRKHILNKDSTLGLYIYDGGFFGYWIRPTYFKNGYIGWETKVVYLHPTLPSYIIEVWGRAYDITQSLGFSPYGKYTFLSYTPYNGAPPQTEKPSNLTDLEVSEEEPTLG